MGLDVIYSYYVQFCEILQGDNVAFLGLLITSFPAALLMKYIAIPTGKQIFSITLAIIQTYLVCKGDTIIPILLCLCSYFALKFFPKDNIGRVIFHISFSLLLVFKLLIFSELFIPSYLTDAVLLLMVLRVVSYGYDYQLNKVLDSDISQEKASTLCSLFDYVGYCFCFVGYWTGPFYNFKTYNNMLHSKTLIRSSKLALWHMRYILLIIPIHVLQNIYNPLDYTKTDEYLERSFAYKLFYQFVGFWTFKCKFYGGWILAEGICIACNLGTKENEDGTVDYSSIINIDIYNVEKQWEFSQCVRAWNKSVQRWMKTYVYDTTKLPKSVRTDFVFALSAFWHGVRPGYYLCFLSAPPMLKLQQKVANLTRDARQSNQTYETIYRVINWLWIRLMSSMFILPFYILDLDRTLAIWSSMYWVPQISLAIVFIISLILPEGSRPERTKSS